MKILRLCVFAVCLLLLFSFQAQAQSIPIQSSQRTVYASPADWIFVSAQGHWGPANSMPFDASLGLLNPAVGHVHVECTAPIYGMIATALTLPCQIQLFHLAGMVVAAQTLAQTDQQAVMTWAATGHPQQTPFDVPLMMGDPMGVRVFPFTLAIDAEPWRATPHGWVATQTKIRVQFDNGTVMDTSLTLPFWVQFDPTAPLNAIPPTIGTSVAPNSPFDRLGGWGTLVMQSNSIVPIAPVVDPTYWTSDEIVHGYTYADANQAPLGIGETRVDMDLHHGSVGFGVPFGHYDPLYIGAGVHKAAMIWREDSGEGNAAFGPHEFAAALFVISVTIPDGSGPPPPSCQPPAIVQNGVCVIPPPPAPVWTQGTVWTTPNGGAALIYHLCPGLNPTDAACIVP